MIRIGRCSGFKFINIERNVSYLFNIKADGPWSISLEQLEKAWVYRLNFVAVFISFQPCLGPIPVKQCATNFSAQIF
jgi:hypothetical protein